MMFSESFVDNICKSVNYDEDAKRQTDSYSKQRMLHQTSPRISQEQSSPKQAPLLERLMEQFLQRDSDLRLNTSFENGC